MQTLARLFGRSPFAPLQTHMCKVASCVQEIIPLFDALEKKDYSLVEEISVKISKMEHDADLTKNDIRNHLPTGLFLPIARASLLEILTLQDNIADKSEDVAVLLTLKEIDLKPSFAAEFKEFMSKNLETFHVGHQIIQELGELLETSFGGSEADKVRKMVDKVAFKEHEADLIQRQLLKKLFGESEKMHSSEFFLWMKVIQELAGISNISEKLANRVGMTLEVK
jgi:uncharacterized protein